MVVQLGESTPSRPGSIWQALRRDSKHAPEIGVLYALPQLTPHVERWWSKTAAAHPSDSPERIAKRVVRRSTHVARRGGLITGSTFYVGMVPAMAMIYCEQLVVVLRIAASYGHDPTDPARAAEILVVQGRYPSVQEAAAALQKAGTDSHLRRAGHGAGATVNVVRQLPAMIGLRVRKFARRSLFDVIITGAEVASYFVPVVSLPVWAFANARSTRRLGNRAIDYYHQLAVQQVPHTAIVLPARPRPRTRRLVIGSVVPLALALGVLFFFLPIGPYHHGVRWVGLAISEAALVLTFARLIRLTRVPTNRQG